MKRYLHLVIYPDLDNHGIHRVDSIWFSEEKAFERLDKVTETYEYSYVIKQGEGEVK